MSPWEVILASCKRNSASETQTVSYTLQLQMTALSTLEREKHLTSHVTKESPFGKYRDRFTDNPSFPETRDWVATRLSQDMRPPFRKKREPQNWQDTWIYKSRSFKTLPFFI